MYSPARVPTSSATSVKGGREGEGGRERREARNESNEEEEEKKEEEEEEEEEGIRSRFERTKLGSSTMVRSRALAGSGAR